MKTLGLILLLALYSCGKDTMSGTTTSSSQAMIAKVLTIPSDLKADVDLINQEIKVYTQMAQIDNLVIEYSSDDTLGYENEARGICIKGANPKILLYSPDWVATTAYNYTKDSFQKTQSLYHLIGHCVFNKAHNDETYQDTAGGSYVFYSPKSFMNSNFKKANFSYTRLEASPASIIQDLKREYYSYYGTW